MDFVADSNLALLDQTFGQHGQIIRIPGREIRRDHVIDADVLLLRSVTRADARLLDGSKVKFVGTATIGTDHLDIEYLQKQGIAWASAPGCNADAAAQYSLAMAWLACSRMERDLRDLSVGIIGRGNVGSRLQNLLKALGIASVACDPPLKDSGVAGLCDLRTALSQPVVSVHVPLTNDGPYPTLHMFNAARLAMMPGGALLVNSSRGDVVDGDALLAELEAGRMHAALDVWPGEPGLQPRLLAHTLTATPHVAGYSQEGKQNGSLMIYRAFCEWSGNSPPLPAQHPSGGPVFTIDTGADAVTAALDACCGIYSDDLAMKSAYSYLPDPNQPAGSEILDGLRKNYRLRRDFSAWSFTGASAEQAATLKLLGFRRAV